MGATPFFVGEMGEKIFQKIEMLFLKKINNKSIQNKLKR
jgi:hypothetical protein